MARAKAVFLGKLRGSEIDFIQGPQYVTVKGVIGRSLLLHEGEDDLGKSGDPTGKAGKRLDCAIIGIAQS